jgi:hypothetical protein
MTHTLRITKPNPTQISREDLAAFDCLTEELDAWPETGYDFGRDRYCNSINEGMWVGDSAVILSGFNLQNWVVRHRNPPYSEQSLTSVPNLREELAKLRHDMDALKIVYRNEVEQLRTRLDRIELDPFEQLFERAEVVDDPYLRWCTDNISKIEERPNSFLAIDIEKGEIVVYDPNQNIFVEKLKKLTSEVREKLYRTHSSMFI